MTSQKSMVTDLTEGNVTRLLFRFAMPLLISNALQAVYNLVDMVVVGQYIGGAGMSAVSIGGDILGLLTFVAMGFSSAGQVLIARDVGARDSDSVRKTIGTMFTFMLLCALVISGICFAIRKNILQWLNTPAESYTYTMEYTVICSAGLLFIYGYNLVSAVLRGMGDSKRPFIFIAIAAVLNTILDIVFVAFCGMGVAGAALATVIGQGTSFAVSLVYLYRNRAAFGFDFKPASFRIDLCTLKRLVKLGVPMAIQSAAIHLSKIVLTSWINMSGVVYSALCGIYNKVGMMSSVVSNSFTTAGSSMTAQNLGAGKLDRIPVILRVVLACGMAISTFFSAVLFMIPDKIYALFTADVSVLAAAFILTIPSVLNFYGSATRAMAFSLINGSGNTKLNLAVAIIDGMISRIGIAALLGKVMKMGCQGYWYGDALAGFMPMVIGCCYYFSGRWKKPSRAQ